MSQDVTREFLSIPEFSLKLGLHRETVEKLIERGIIHAVRFTENGKTIIPISEIARLAKEYRR